MKLYIYGDDENNDINVESYELILNDTTNKLPSIFKESWILPNKDIVIIENVVVILQSVQDGKEINKKMTRFIEEFENEHDHEPSNNNFNTTQRSNDSAKYAFS